MISFASVIGSGLQFAVQVPTVMRFLRPLNLKLRLGSEHVQTVVRNFFPVFVSRGVVQISAYVDSLLASLSAYRCGLCIGLRTNPELVARELVRHGDFGG